MRSSKIWARRASTADARRRSWLAQCWTLLSSSAPSPSIQFEGRSAFRRPAPDHRLLTDSELEAVRAGIAAWLRKERSGPRSSGDIADIIEVMLATGARIGEELAWRWADIDLGARIVEPKATIKTESSVGTFRKSIARPRVVALPESAAQVLLARRRSTPDNFLDAVFSPAT